LENLRNTRIEPVPAVKIEEVKAKYR
jgi:hypothetical protein